MPLVLRLVVLTVFIPVELSFYIFGLRLTATRLVLLLIAPFLLGLFVRKLTTNRYRFVLSDLFVVVTGAWLIYAPANIDDLSSALNHAGPDVLEFCVGYFATRLALSSHNEAVNLAGLLCRVIAVVAIIGLLDSITGSYITHAVARQLTGFNQIADFSDWGDAYRLGILRATGPIEHPILFGFLCVVGFLIAVVVPISQRKLLTAGDPFSVHFSRSLRRRCSADYLDWH